MSLIVNGKDVTPQVRGWLAGLGSRPGAQSLPASLEPFVVSYGRRKILPFSSSARAAMDAELAAGRSPELPAEWYAVLIDGSEVTEPIAHNCRSGYCTAPTGQCPNPE